MNNIKFKYLYRDAGNYKNYGFRIFKNPDNLPLSEIEKELEAAFLDGLYFIAKQIDLPELFHDDYPTTDDVSFHEYDGSESSTEMLTGSSIQTIKEFVDKVLQESAIGWKLFDPQDRLFHT